MSKRKGSLRIERTTELGKYLTYIRVSRGKTQQEIAEKLVEQLFHPNIINYLQLTDKVGILESPTPDSFVGKTLKQLSLRNKYGINLIAIKRKIKKKGEKNIVEEVMEVPSAEEKIQEGDILLVIGKKEYLEKFKNLQREVNESEGN